MKILMNVDLKDFPFESENAIELAELHRFLLNLSCFTD